MLLSVPCSMHHRVCIGWLHYLYLLSFSTSFLFSLPIVSIPNIKTARSRLSIRHHHTPLILLQCCYHSLLPLFAIYLHLLSLFTCYSEYTKRPEVDYQSAITSVDTFLEFHCKLCHNKDPLMFDAGRSNSHWNSQSNCQSNLTRSI